MSDLERFDRELGQWLDDGRTDTDPPQPPAHDEAPELQGLIDAAEASSEVHPGWEGIKLGSTGAGMHAVRWGNQDELAGWREMRTRCLAETTASCRWTCPADCELIPCEHKPIISACNIVWGTDQVGDDAFYEESIEKHGHVDALVDAEWEGESWVLSYTENALGEVTPA